MPKKTVLPPIICTVGRDKTKVLTKEEFIAYCEKRIEKYNKEMLERQKAG